MLSVNRRIQIPDEEFAFTYTRSSGPGGQNVNKVNSKAILHWDATRSPSLPDDVRERLLLSVANRINGEGFLVISSERYRDQPRNAADCLEKLRAMLEAVATPPKRRRATKPSRAARERRLEKKSTLSAKKQSRQKPKWD